MQYSRSKRRTSLRRVVLYDTRPARIVHVHFSPTLFALSRGSSNPRTAVATETVTDVIQTTTADAPRHTRVLEYLAGSPITTPIPGSQNSARPTHHQHSYLSALLRARDRLRRLALVSRALHRDQYQAPACRTLLQKKNAYYWRIVVVFSLAGIGSVWLRHVQCIYDSHLCKTKTV